MTPELATRPMRVIVCGTTFGQVYLEGLREPTPALELAGILGHGSERTRRCAELYGVPMYTDPAELPADIDAACVVVRSGLLGGAGAQLAQTLMARGIHVLQEHPLHLDELAACLRAARRAGVVYGVNAFYPHVEPVRRFLAAARELLDGERPVYLDAACGFQLAYSLLDIVGQAIGRVRPFALAEPGPPPPGPARPFRSLEGEIGGVPVTLRVQNEMDPSDPDNHAHLDHRIVLGTEGANLTLVSTHGPIVLAHRPRYPHAPGDPGSDPHFAGADGTLEPSATVLGSPDATSFDAIFRSSWPPAVRSALGSLRHSAITGEGWLARGQHHLSVCLLWQEIAARLGPPELIRRPAPKALAPEHLAAITRAGAGTTPVLEAVAP